MLKNVTIDSPYYIKARTAMAQVVYVGALCVRVRVRVRARARARACPRTRAYA